MITNIQRMCFHDGPGIRTTVFLKGCSLHCPWCSNPENISFEPQNYSLNGEEGIYGREYTCEQLFEVLQKDKIFWAKDGGVTFSGGEALMQMKALEKLFLMLKQQNINIAVETALFIPEDYLEIALKYVSYFLVDIKILNKSLCKEILGGNLDLYLSNVEKLCQSGKNIIFRIPCNYEYTFSEKNKERIFSFLLQHRNIHTQIFRIHDLGRNKYESLGLFSWKHREIYDHDLNKFCELLQQNNIKVEVIRI